jgi:hypothetical protein
MYLVTFLALNNDGIILKITGLLFLTSWKLLGFCVFDSWKLLENHSFRPVQTLLLLLPVHELTVEYIKNDLRLRSLFGSALYLLFGQNECKVWGFDLFFTLVKHA